jgi:hypothetical protein
VNLEDALAVADTRPLHSGYFVEAPYGVANGEYAFLVILALRPEETTGRGSGTSGSGEFTAYWGTKGGATLAFRCTVPTAKTAAGWMEIAGTPWSLAKGRVFLVKTRAGAVADPSDVQQVEAPLVGDTPQEVLKNLVSNSGAVRGFLTAELIEGLGSGNPTRRSAAALFLYRCGLAEEAKTSLGVDLLKDDKGWVRLMAAKALWDRQRHEAAIPTLVALLQDAKQYGWVRRGAARVLGEIGPAAQAAIPALREALNSEDTESGTTAAEALKRIEK